MKVKSSPFVDNAANVFSHDVIFCILVFRIACGGRYTAISEGKVWDGKLMRNQSATDGFESTGTHLIEARQRGRFRRNCLKQAQDELELGKNL